MQPGEARDRLTSGMHIPQNEKEAVGALEFALLSTLTCEPLQAAVAKARKEGKIKSRDEMEQVAEAASLGVISGEQANMLKRDYALRRAVIMVNDFDPAELPAGK
jgi:acyl-CoA dehydrogenase